MIDVSLSGLSSLSRPYLAIRKGASGYVAEGMPRVELGHRVGRNNGESFDGIFAYWAWDGGRFVVENDRYGIYPVFYCSWGGEFWISPSIQHVLKGNFPKNLDMSGLAVFLRMGLFLDEDTPFEHIKALPPGARLTWQDGQISLQRGSREPGNPPPDMATSFDETVDQYQALFQQALERRPPPPGGYDIALSAGRDSRHILFELLRQGHRPNRSVTVQAPPPADDEDRSVARQLAAESGVPHDEINYHASYLEAALKDMELTELCATSHIWLAPLAGYFRMRDTRCIYDGLAGGVLSGGQLVSSGKLELLRQGKTRKLAERLLGASGNEEFIKSAYRPKFVAQIRREEAVERLAKELERHQDFPSPLVSFIFWNRTRRYISLLPFGLLGDVETIYCPYLDHDLFDFLINVPPEHSMRKSFHDETIKRHYPKYAHIPFEAPDATPPSRKEFNRYYRKAARETLLHLARSPQLARSDLVKTGRFAAMLMRSALQRNPGSLWYLQPLLRRLETERLIRESGGDAW